MKTNYLELHYRIFHTKAHNTLYSEMTQSADQASNHTAKDYAPKRKRAPIPMRDYSFPTCTVEFNGFTHEVAFLVEALFQELDARNEEINNLLTDSGSVWVDQYGDPEDE